jgi:hypothetical protein
MKTALIHADRQTDKHEANWRFCDCANGIKISCDSREGTLQGNISVVLNRWGQEAKYVLLPAIRSP